MKMKWIAVPAVAFALAAPSGVLAGRAYAAAPSPSGFAQERPWDQPPPEFRDAQRRGFRDGIDAARKDFDHHRHKDAADHDRFRHPPVDRSLHEDYRDGFRRGYDSAMRHMMEGDHHDHY